MECVTVSSLLLHSYLSLTGFSLVHFFFFAVHLLLNVLEGKLTKKEHWLSSNQRQPFQPRLLYCGLYSQRKLARSVCLCPVLFGRRYTHSMPTLCHFCAQWLFPNITPSAVLILGQPGACVHPPLLWRNRQRQFQGQRAQIRSPIRPISPTIWAAEWHGLQTAVGQLFASLWLFALERILAQRQRLSAGILLARRLSPRRFLKSLRGRSGFTHIGSDYDMWFFS